MKYKIFRYDSNIKSWVEDGSSNSSLLAISICLELKEQYPNLIYKIVPV